jgi:hypothetical protein
LENEWLRIRSINFNLRTPDEQVVFQMFPDRNHARVYGAYKSLCELAVNILPIKRTELQIDAVGSVPTEHEWNALTELIGMTKAWRATSIDKLDASRRPLHVLDGQAFLLGDIANALDVLWSCFDDLAATDGKFYDGEYAIARSKWSEDEVVRLLKSVFPPNTVYQKLSYSDPDKTQQATAELDVAVTYGPFLILIEVKTHWSHRSFAQSLTK